MTEVLEAGGAVGFIADQNAGSKGVFVDFFGRKASTYKSIASLAMHYKVPVVIGYARRQGASFHFKIGAQDIIYPADWKSQDDPLRYITQRYTRAIEDMVRVDPGNTSGCTAAGRPGQKGKWRSRLTESCVRSETDRKRKPVAGREKSWEASVQQHRLG